jgi:hypothetical protein
MYSSFQQQSNDKFIGSIAHEFGSNKALFLYARYLYIGLMHSDSNTCQTGFLLPGSSSKVKNKKPNCCEIFSSLQAA